MTQPTVTQQSAMTKNRFDFQAQAIEFREVMGQPVAVATLESIMRHAALIDEEYGEVGDAITEFSAHLVNKRAAEAALKELADLVYVCFQFAAAMGWELDEALARVHESNLSKLVDGKPIINENGKVMKGPNYQPPSLIDLV